MHLPLEHFSLLTLPTQLFLSPLQFFFCPGLFLSSLTHGFLREAKEQWASTNQDMG